jgi:hypothetical protein
MLCYTDFQTELSVSPQKNKFYFIFYFARNELTNTYLHLGGIGLPRDRAIGRSSGSSMVAVIVTEIFANGSHTQREPRF